MALIYYDQTIKGSYELVMAGLSESSSAISIHELGNYVSHQTQFPRSVCYKIIKEVLDKGLTCKSIRQVGDLYITVPTELLPNAKTKEQSRFKNVKNLNQNKN
ncbi:uncharacterized protein LOC117791504 [Drosophila innubila]|uniref:uncharacterized protein LOC117791504 n=1 Tax=Drosophila innubila TaxID=198719 RepID=UPI00148B785B|nr:uncharacterized protein LOC117791504 [Drosophila innubila]